MKDKEYDTKEAIALGGLCCCNTRKAIIKRISRQAWDGSMKEALTIKFQHRDPGSGKFYDDNYFHMNKDELGLFITMLQDLHQDMEQ